MRPPRIALVGNLANVAYQTCKFLRRRGVQADVFVNEGELASTASNPENLESGILQNPPQWLRIVSALPKPWPLRRSYSNVRLFITLRHYNLIQSFCCAPSFIRALGRPYVSFATGSDLRELAVADTPDGHHARSIFQHAQIVFFGADRGSFDAARRLKLKNSFFPYPLIIDTDFFAPNETWRPDANELLVFHPSHLDWTYQGRDRWTKGNDRLFRAFAKLVKAGYSARLVYLERGEDVEPTRRLVAELGIGKQVETHTGNMSRAQLCQYYNLADVVADQFNIGLGVSGQEAMSCGRPVLVSVDPEVADLCYQQQPPVLNCGTEDEIYEQLKSAMSPEYRARIGEQAREWIMKHNHWKKVVERLVWHYESILGTHVT